MLAAPGREVIYSYCEVNINEGWDNVMVGDTGGHVANLILQEGIV